MFDFLFNLFNPAPPQPARSSADHDELPTADQSNVSELDSLRSAWIDRCRWHERNIKEILTDRTNLVQQGYGCVLTIFTFSYFQRTPLCLNQDPP